MLISKDSLKCHKLAEADRYSLNGVHFSADGTTTVTNGHYAVRYSPKGNPPDEEFPLVEGVNVESSSALEPFTMPTAAVVQLLKAIPKRSAIPVCEYAALDVEATNKNGQATIGITDLESPQILRPAKLEGTFPNVENVIPGGKAKVEVILDSTYLEKLGRWFREVGAKSVKVSVYAADKPVKLEAKTANGDALAVLMPQHDG
jgi:DNA polymerase III sliding clamp (beta) subunit (PCNA family)